MKLKLKTLKPSLFFQTLLVSAFLLYGCGKDDSLEPNNLPVAIAAGNLKVEIGSVVKLDASGSNDPDGDDLTYNWSFLSKPDGSVASIIGAGNENAEFTLDKAGSYKVELTVSDGTTEAMTSLTISNLTPLLNGVNTDTNFSLPDELAEKGKTIYINGDFFSKVNAENKVTIGDIEYEIETLSVGSNNDQMSVKVPDEAVSGDLKVTVGDESVVWPTPIRMITYPADAFVKASEHLEEHIRDQPTFFEIGTRFKPLVNGKVVGLLLRLPLIGDFKVTLWDEVTKQALVTKTFAITSSSLYTRSILLTTPIALESGHVYVVTVNSNKWYNHIDEDNALGNQFPLTVGNIEVLSTAYIGGTDTKFPDEGLPNNYITRGADIIFAADVIE